MTRHCQERSTAIRRPAFGVLVALLTAVGVLLMGATAATAQEPRPRIVVAVIPSGEIPEGIDRDVQDLFLTALAEQDEYELVDRQSIFELSHLDGDVDLLLCVTQGACLNRLHDEHRFEQFVIVKVNEVGGTLEFTYVNFSFQNRDPLVFGAKYDAPVSNPSEFVNRAFEVAQQLELVPVDSSAATDPCADVACPESQTCVEGRCEDDIEGAGASEPPLDGASSGIDWRVLTGGIVAGVGVATLAAGVGLLADREGRIQSLADAYEGTGSFRVSGFGQNKAAGEVDTINTFGTVGPVLLIVGGTAALAGAGLLTWGLLDTGTAEAEAGELSLEPTFAPGRLGVDARVTF